MGSPDKGICLICVAAQKVKELWFEESSSGCCACAISSSVKLSQPEYDRVSKQAKSSVSGDLVCIQFYCTKADRELKPPSTVYFDFRPDTSPLRVC
jgi:hypothetical protein